MPYANRDGIPICYRVEGNRPWLVLAHGLGFDHRMWRELGYVDALAPDYRLVAIDVRGHGRSGKPKRPAAYRSSRRVADVVAVLDDLGISRAHFLGYGMGAGLGFEMANHAPNRLLSLILGGAQPYSTDPPAGGEMRTMLESGLEAAAASVEEIHGHIPPGMKATALANDREALLACLDRPREDLLPGLLRFAGPCLLYAGGADPAHDGANRLAAEMPRATFVSLSGLDHWAALASADSALPPIKAFLESVAER